MAVSHDGGSTWKMTGAVMWASAPTTREQVVSTSTDHVWAAQPAGPLLETRDGGRHWNAQPVPTPVEQLTVAGGTVWTLSCAAVGVQATNSCTPVVEQQSASGGGWRRLALPVTSVLLGAHLHVVTPTTAVVSATLAGAAPGSAGQLVTTSDGGVHWTVQPLPTGPNNWCNGDTPTFAAGSATTWWLLCNGSAAAGSSEKAVLQSTDGGSAWTTVSEVPNLQTPLPAGSLTAADTNNLSTASPTLLWLASSNQLTESTDGGHHWQPVPSVKLHGQGIQATFDVYSPTRAWMLAPLTALWSTTDGTTWRQVP